MDGVEFTLSYQEPTDNQDRTEHSIWTYLLNHSDADTANRLRRDPAFQVNPQLLTVQMNDEGTRGFSVSVDQLLRERALWVPELDVFIAAGDELHDVPAASSRDPDPAGQRILDQLRTGPGGDLRAVHRALGGHGQPGLPESAFRPARPHRRPDLGQRHSQVRHRPRGGGLERLRQSGPVPVPAAISRAGTWKGQRLDDGLPVLTTTFEQAACAWRSSSSPTRWTARRRSGAATSRWCCSRRSGHGTRRTAQHA